MKIFLTTMGTLGNAQPVVALAGGLRRAGRQAALGALFALFAAGGAYAETGSAPPKFEIPDSAVHEIESEALGRTYEIFVKTPPGYDSAEEASTKYPVIYLNDGPYTFQVASGVTRLPMNAGKFQKALLVGVSFARGENGMDSRVRDLTPTEDKSWTRYRTGGGPAYLEFLEREVLPFVETHYRADPSRRTLAGQSLGGSFGAWVLLTRPGLFDSYILTSPSLWFHGRNIFAFEERYAADHEDLKAKVYIAVGEHETPERGGTRNDMVGDQIAFVAQLRSRNYPGLIVRAEIIDGAIHETAFPIGFTRGAQWLFHEIAQP